MLPRKWSALGTTITATALLLGCGGDSDLSIADEPEAPLIAALDSALALPAPVTTAVAAPAERCVPQPAIVFAAPITTPPPAASSASARAPAPALATAPVKTGQSVAATLPAAATLRAAASTQTMEPAAVAPITKTAPRKITAHPTPVPHFTAPIPTTPAISIAPMPAASPISIPPRPSIPPISIPPSPSASASTSATHTFETPTNASRNSRIGLAGNDEFFGKKMIGFTNVGQTCYANSALKFLIHSIGPAALISHLEAIAPNIPVAVMASRRELAALIRIAHTQPASLSKEMTRLFTTFENTEQFSGEKIIGIPRSSGFFYGAMHHLLGIKTIDNGGLSFVRTFINSKGQMQKADVEMPILVPLRNDMTLQDLVNTFCGSDIATGMPAGEFQVSDENALKTVNFMIDIPDASSTNQLDFKETVTLPILHKSSGKKFIATLKAKAIVFPKNSGADITHYVAYLKYDEKDFSLHDDWIVRDGIEIKEGNYPELISFSVEKMEAAP